MIAPGRELARGRSAARALEELVGRLRQQAPRDGAATSQASMREPIAHFLHELRTYLAQNRDAAGGLAQKDVRMASLLPILRRNRERLLGQSHELCRRVRHSDGKGAIEVAQTLLACFRD